MIRPQLKIGIIIMVLVITISGCNQNNIDDQELSQLKELSEVYNENDESVISDQEIIEKELIDEAQDQLVKELLTEDIILIEDLLVISEVEELSELYEFYENIDLEELIELEELLELEALLSEIEELEEYYDLN